MRDGREARKGHGGEKRNIVPGMSSRNESRSSGRSKSSDKARGPYHAGLRVFQYVASIAEKHATVPRYGHSVWPEDCSWRHTYPRSIYRSTLFDIDEYRVTTVKRFADARCISLFSYSVIYISSM